MSLTLGFTENLGGENTEIKYIGLKGEMTNLKQQAVVTVYESQANLKDHEVGTKDEQSHFIE